jgi:hypothetical protein
MRRSSFLSSRRLRLGQRLLLLEERQQPSFLATNTSCGGFSFLKTRTASTSTSSTATPLHFSAGMIRPRPETRNTTTATSSIPWWLLVRRRLYTSSSNTFYTSSSYTSSSSSPASNNAFWKDLNLAVKHGNGEQAEDIVNRLLKSYQDERENESESGAPGDDDSNNNDSQSQVLDTRIFSLVLEAWNNSMDPLAAERAQQLLDQMVALADEGLLTEYPSTEDYHAVLDCWAASGDATLQAAESALRITQQMMMNTIQAAEDENTTAAAAAGSAAGVQLSEQTVLRVLQILANGGHAVSAREFVETTTIAPTVDMYNLILEAYARSSTLPNAPQAAQDLLEDMAAALSMANNSNSEEEEEEEEEDSIAKNTTTATTKLPQPNGTSYDWVIHCWATHAPEHPEAAHRAQRLLAEMKNNRTLQTTLASYQNVISILAHQGDAPQAERLLTSLVKEYGAQFDAQLKPTLQPFETVLVAYSNSFHANAAPRAESVLIHMRELYESGLLDSPPDVWSYNLVLKCWMHHSSKQQQHTRNQQHTHNHKQQQQQQQQHDAAERALALLERMRQDYDVTPDTSTMNTVLNTLAKSASSSSSAERAEAFLWEFYQSYLEDPIRNPQPDVISFGTVLKAWALSASSSSSNNTTTNANNNNNANVNMISERAETLLLKLQHLHESGWTHCQPDQAIYSSVMKCYVAAAAASKDNHNNNKTSPAEIAAEKAEALLRSMQVSAQEQGNFDLKPDTVCWNMAIQAWAQAGQGPRAEALFKEMLQDYLDEDGATAAAAPNNITFSAVLSAWAKTQKNPQASERAERLLQQMKHLAAAAAANDDNNNDDASGSSNKRSLPDIKPNVVSYSIVLDCLAYAKTTAAAIRAQSLLREMQASDDPAVQPNVISYNSVIKAWSLSRDPNALFKVTALLKEMMEQAERQQHGHTTNKNNKPTTTPNANTFGSVLKVLADSHVPDKEKRARVVVKLMEKFQIPWNDWSRHQMKRCARGDGNGSRGRRGGRRTMKQQQQQNSTDTLPDVPDLKYS